jgi:hypothetical protein
MDWELALLSKIVQAQAMKLMFSTMLRTSKSAA